MIVGLAAVLLGCWAALGAADCAYPNTGIFVSNAYDRGCSFGNYAVNTSCTLACKEPDFVPFNVTYTCRANGVFELDHTSSGSSNTTCMRNLCPFPSFLTYNYYENAQGVVCPRNVSARYLGGLMTPAGTSCYGCADIPGDAQTVTCRIDASGNPYYDPPPQPCLLTRCTWLRDVYYGDTNYLVCNESTYGHPPPGTVVSACTRDNPVELVCVKEPGHNATWTNSPFTCPVPKCLPAPALFPGAFSTAPCLAGSVDSDAAGAAIGSSCDIRCQDNQQERLMCAFNGYAGAQWVNQYGQESYIAAHCGLEQCGEPRYGPSSLSNGASVFPANYSSSVVVQCNANFAPQNGYPSPMTVGCLKSPNGNYFAFQPEDYYCQPVSKSGFLQKYGSELGAGVALIIVVATVGVCVCLYRRGNRARAEARAARNAEDGDSRRLTGSGKGSSVRMDDLGDSTVRLNDSAMADRIKKLLNAPATTLIGTGGTADVFRATMEGGNVVAIKRLKDGQKGHEDEFAREVTILSQLVGLSHPNVVSLLQYCDKPPTIVMEFAGGGSVRSALATLSATQRREYMKQISSGLAFVHGHDIVHLDIKTENCLIGSGDVLKITDFGTARKSADETGPNNGPPDGLALVGAFVGTVQYAAPERFRTGARVDLRKADVFSLGMTIWCIASGQTPFAGEHIDTVVDFSMMGSYETKVSSAGVDTDVMSHVTACINRDPAQRPSCAQIFDRLCGNNHSRSMSTVSGPQDETVRLDRSNSRV